jgi:hypothetical protein
MCVGSKGDGLAVAEQRTGTKAPNLRLHHPRASVAARNQASGSHRADWPRPPRGAAVCNGASHLLAMAVRRSSVCTATVSCSRGEADKMCG